MDVLSDALRVMRVACGVFFTARMTSPWSVTSPPAERLRPILAPEAECLAHFHILVEGEPCWVALQGRPSVRMAPGDLIILPQGEQHVMTSDLALPAPPVEQSLRSIPAIFANALPGRLPQMNYGGGGPASHLVCGYLQCDQSFNPLLGALPQAVLVRVRDGAATVQTTTGTTELRQLALPAEAANWIETTLRYAVSEAHAANPAGGTMLARLAELVFAEVMRRYIEKVPEREAGWLAALNDAQVARVLKLIHADPKRGWTVAALGKAAGISRSALAERFAALIGESPMRYLAGWRMQLAKRLLRESGQSVAEIAAAVGYESEAAFNRAFRRLVGKPPAKWRDGGKPAQLGPAFVGNGSICERRAASEPI
jgi:AraC-like DNA-binding protein